MTSIILLAYNKLELTKLCLYYLRKYTDMNRIELIVVDNGSTDGTTEWLKNQNSINKLIIHTENQGYTKGFNSGIKEASYEEVFLLANDILVTPNWLENLRKCLNHSNDVGLVVPIMNYASNGQSIAVEYQNLEDMIEFSKKHNVSEPAKWEERAKLITCCAIGKRRIFEEVGFFDEIFENGGSFSDDDLSLKIISKGYKLFLSKDTFVHHYGSQTVSEGLMEDLRRGRKVFKEKWGFDSWEKSTIAFDFIHLLLNVNKGPIKVLEVGCGISSTLLQLKQGNKQLKIFGIEPNQQAAEVGQIFGEVLSVDILKDELKFEKNYFDVIILTGITQENYSIEQIIDKLLPHLKDKGLLLGKFENIMCIRTIQGLISGTYSANKINHYSIGDLRSIYDRLGLHEFIASGLSINATEKENQFIEFISNNVNHELTPLYRYSHFYVTAKK